MERSMWFGSRLIDCCGGNAIPEESLKMFLFGPRFNYRLSWLLMIQLTKMYEQNI